MNYWKISTIILIFIVVTLLFTIFIDGVNEFNEEVSELFCSNEICADFEGIDGFIYDSVLNKCECYVDGEIIYSKTLD